MYKEKQLFSKVHTGKSFCKEKSKSTFGLCPKCLEIFLRKVFAKVHTGKSFCKKEKVLLVYFQSA